MLSYDMKNYADLEERYAPWPITLSSIRIIVPLSNSATSNE